MDGNRNQHFKINTKRKTGKQFILMNGSKVLTAKEVKEFINKNYDDNEDCLLLVHVKTFNEDVKENKTIQQVMFTKEMEF